MIKKMRNWRGGRVAILALATLVVIIAAALWLVRDNGGDNPPSTPGIPNNQSMPSGGSNNPDPVKQENGPNGEISPSPSGTGPGSDRSLLGPQPEP